MRPACFTLGTLLLASLALTAHAEPITFTETLTGSSYYGPNAGTVEPITITGYGNTSNIVFNSAQDEYTLLLSSTTLQVGSSPVETFTGTVQAFEADGFIAGFEQLTPQDVNIAAVDGFDDPFATYALNSNISVTDGTQVPQSYTIFNTTGGSFDFATFSTTANFSSSIPPSVPEPSSLVLLSTGLLGLGETVRRKFRAARSL